MNIQQIQIDLNFLVKELASEFLQFVLKSIVFFDWNEELAMAFKIVLWKGKS
jgi:hypothetical protein